MGNSKLKKEDVLYYLDKLLEAKGTNVINTLFYEKDEKEGLIISNENFRFSLIFHFHPTFELSVASETKNESRGFIYQELKTFSLSDDEAFSISKKMEQRDRAMEEALIEGFMLEIKEMREIDAKCL